MVIDYIGLEIGDSPWRAPIDHLEVMIIIAILYYSGNCVPNYFSCFVEVRHILGRVFFIVKLDIT